VTAAASAPWIAVSGIDGAGKTTLLEWLRRDVLPGATVHKKTDRADAERVARHHPVFPLEDGTAAVTYGWATLFDHLAHTRRVERDPGDGAVLLDRWTPCVAAWCGAVLGLGLEPVDELTAGVRRPDLTLFLECRPVVARRRLERRGTPRPDEDRSILDAFAVAYEQVLARPGTGPVVRVAEGDQDSVRRATRAALADHGLAP
jgi:thymidylate kinase